MCQNFSAEMVEVVRHQMPLENDMYLAYMFTAGEHFIRPSLLLVPATLSNLVHVFACS